MSNCIKRMTYLIRELCYCISCRFYIHIHHSIVLIIKYTHIIIQLTKNSVEHFTHMRSENIKINSMCTSVLIKLSQCVQLQVMNHQHSIIIIPIFLHWILKSNNLMLVGIFCHFNCVIIFILTSSPCRLYFNAIICWYCLKTNNCRLHYSILISQRRRDFLLDWKAFLGEISSEQ